MSASAVSSASQEQLKTTHQNTIPSDPFLEKHLSPVVPYQPHP